MNKMFQSYFNDFIATMDALEVRYVVLRGYQTLPQEVSNDIDFGVHPDDEDSFFDALKEYREKHNVDIRLNLSRYKVLKLKFCYVDQSIDFDFWFDLNYVGMHYIEFDRVLNNRSTFRNFYIPQPADELTISFLKELLHMKQLRKDKVAHLTELLNQINIDDFASLYSSNARLMFCEVIQSKKYNLQRESKRTKKELWRFNVKKLGVRKTLKHILLYVKYRLFPSSNPLVKKLSFI